jgi:hypothetical protein
MAGSIATIGLGSTGPNPIEPGLTELRHAKP